MNRNYLRIIYLTVGAISLLFFAWTGNYLNTRYPDKRNMDMGVRVMLRSRHIFILLISLLDINIGLYVRPSGRTIIQIGQGLATFFLLMAHGLFIWAFFYEVSTETIPRTPVLHWATYCALAGVAVHGLVYLIVRWIDE